jgi:transcriptional regulator with XRE-family HTH domain
MNNKTLASVVKEAREKINISQRELSRITGIDNNTIAKIEKGERKKPNVLSLKKLSSVLNLSLKMLMELCEYSKEEIDSTVNNSYSSMVIKPENVPILVLDDIVNQMQDELYIKMVIKDLLDNCNLEELNFISELNKKDKNRVIKVMKNYIKDNEKEIKKQKQSIDDLKKLLTKEE